MQMGVVPIEARGMVNITVLLQDAGVKGFITRYGNLELKVSARLEMNIDVVACTQLNVWPWIVWRNNPSMKVMEIGRVLVRISMRHSTVWSRREAVFEMGGDRIARHHLYNGCQIVAVIIFGLDFIAAYIDERGPGCQIDLDYVMTVFGPFNSAFLIEWRLAGRLRRAYWELVRYCGLPKETQAKADDTDPSCRSTPQQTRSYSDAPLH